MRKFLKFSAQALVALTLLAVCAGLYFRTELTRLLAVNSLFAADRIVSNFSHMDTMFVTHDMDGGTATPLPQGQPMILPEGFDTWLADRNVTGIVVLHQGAIVHEGYFLGTGPEDRRISWSVAKSAASLVLGTLVADGTIPDLDVPVTDYVPELASSAYAGATIRNVLNMASGVEFDEDYLDFWSDINRMGRVLAMGGSMDGFAASITERRGAPGADWQYVSIDTHVLAMVMRAASGESLPDLVQTRLFQPIGLESDPYYLTDGDGVAFALGGLNMMTRDYARIGQLVLQDGQWNDAQVVPADWIAQSIVPSAPAGALYGYQWWIPPNAQDEVLARGVYGQYIWIDHARDVVIAVNAADRGFREGGVYDANVAMFRRLSAAFN